MQLLKKDFLTAEKSASMPWSRWSAEGAALVAEGLRHGSNVRLRVHGESMLPALWPGDVVEIEGCSVSDLRPGEIVLALREGRLFLHRLIAPCKPDGFQLRGDSVPRSDPDYPPEALLGRLVSGIDEQRDFSASVLIYALGRLFSRCGLAQRLALKFHSRRTAPANALPTFKLV